MAKLRKVESKTKEFILFFAETELLPAPKEQKVTKKACKSEAILED